MRCRGTAAGGTVHNAIKLAAVPTAALALTAGGASAAPVEVGFVLMPRQGTYDFFLDLKDQWVADGGSFANLPTISEMTVDQHGPDSPFLLGLIYGVIDPDPADSILLAGTRIEANVSDTSPTLDYSQGGYLTASDYGKPYLYGSLVGPDGRAVTGDDVVLSGDPSQTFHAAFGTAYIFEVDADEQAGVTEPFEIEFGVTSRDQGGDAVNSRGERLTVLPAAAVPEPVGGGLALAGLGCLVARRPARTRR